MLIDFFLDNVINAIKTHIPHYQMYIKSLKEQNFTVVGYARKSPGSENEENRNILLNRIVKFLKKRSLCDIIFAV